MKFRYYTTSVRISFPSIITTKEGVKIGTSTAEDLIKIYGDPLNATFNILTYKFKNDVWIWFVFYDIEEIDEEYDPDLKDKIITFEIY